MKKIFLLIFSITISVNILTAQSIVGTWKTISNVIEDLDGSKSDMVTMQLKHWPCMADLHTIFDANGKQFMKSPKNCGPIDYNKFGASTWKMNGNTISITNKEMPNPLGITSTYTVSLAGNKAILTHEYSAEEKNKLHSSKIKKVIITYQRV
jgi:hypothetical protein